MDALRKQRLTAAGIDLNSALERFMGNEALLERFLKRFLQDENSARLNQELTAGDMETALAAAHTLKGVCGNLSMSALYDLFSRQVAAFRAGDVALAMGLMAEIQPALEKTRRAIEEM